MRILRRNGLNAIMLVASAMADYATRRFAARPTNRERLDFPRLPDKRLTSELAFEPTVSTHDSRVSHDFSST